MSNAIYPTLRGLGFGTQRNVLPPKVTIRPTPSRREYRSRSATLPLHAYTLQYNFLRTTSAFAELQTLVGFYKLRGGPFDSFLFLDPADNTASNQLLGYGDGSNRGFQLVSNEGGFTAPVRALVANTLQVFIDGVSTTATSDGNAFITLTTTPGAGAVVTWSGQYYRRVRFDGDQLDTSKFLMDVWEAKRVQLMETPT